MPKVPHTNDTDKFMHVGSVTIPPGETRDVDPTLLPGYEPEEEEKPQEHDNPLDDILLKSIADIVTLLPEVPSEQLLELEAMESVGKNRKGLLEAIAAEQLKRAQG